MSEDTKNLPRENAISPITSEQNITSETNLNSNDTSDKDNNIDWHKMAHKLREHNRKLLKKVFQLEQDILESNQALEEQKKTISK